MATVRLILLGMILVAAVRAPAQEPLADSPVDRGEPADLFANEDPWRDTLRAFDQWAIVQQVYTPKQAAEMRAKILEKSHRLSPEEGEKFRAEIDAKLAVLLSAEAREARTWLSTTLAVASDSYANKIKAKIPDVVKSSPDQLQAGLDTFEYRRGGVPAFQQGVQQSREMTVKATQDDARRQAEAAARARTVPIYTPPPGGKAIGGPNSRVPFHSPYGLKDPYAPFFRFW